MTQRELIRLMEDEYGLMCRAYSITGESLSMKQMIRAFAKAIAGANQG